MSLQSAPGGEISVRAYARHRGVSHQAVMRAVRSKRLDTSLVWVGGVAKIASVSQADAEWAAKTDVSRLPNAEREAAASRLRRMVTAGPDHVTSEPDQPEQSMLSLAAATAAHKHWQAQLAELEFKEAARQLVNAEATSARMVDLIVQCRTKLLGLPSKAKQALPHLTHADLVALDGIVRDALEDLATDPAADRTVA